jgi:tripartite-type tricarboxylate transporter receptor subunit TctC
VRLSEPLPGKPSGREAMITKLPILTRRSFCGGIAAAAGVPLVSTRGSWAQAAYPSRAFRVMVPTGQGGGAERLARSFDGLWSKLLNNQPFEYEFQAGAAGQVGYTLFVQKREHDGYNLLFGNMGPEMIMYVTQKPDYKFPQDYVYFCRTDIDDSCVFVRKDSSYKNIKDVVEAAKKKTLNVALSRIPHPATIGMLALGEATGAKFNFIPYGGGNPTYTALLSGEADVGALPITGVLSLKDKFRVLTVFNDKNIFAAQTEDAPPVNKVFGTSIPELSSSRSWAVHTSWADANAKDLALLERTAKEVTQSPEFKEAFIKTGAPPEAIVYGDRKVCTDYALKMVELAKKYEKQLSAKG